jgi:hypothetical protein
MIVPDLKNNPLIAKLLKLELPSDDFAVFGSGPMMAHGLKESRDLDLIARGAAWEKALVLGELAKTPKGDDKVTIGDIEIFSAWGPGQWDIDALIDGAEIIGGIRFVRLEEVLKWKRLMGRPKDAGHIALIEEHLASKSGMG